MRGSFDKSDFVVHFHSTNFIQILYFNHAFLSSISFGNMNGGFHCSFLQMGYTKIGEKHIRFVIVTHGFIIVKQLIDHNIMLLSTGGYADDN